MKKILTLLLLSCIGVSAFAQLTCTISTFTNPNCNSTCNGSATVMATGGVSPYTYLWMPGNITTPTISNMCAGSYTCTVTDQNATVCSSTITLVAPTAITLTTMPFSASVCVGNSINYTATATGGVPPYTYSWACPGGSPPTASTQNPVITYNSVGSYTTTLTVQDGNGCIATTNIPVTVSASSVGGSLSGATTICSGNNNGVIVLSGQTGAVIRWEMSTDGGLTWVNIANTTTSQSFTNLSVTTMYRALVQSGACPSAYSGTATVTVIASPTVTTTEIPATCGGNGTVMCTPAGGPSPFTFLWVPTNNTTQSAFVPGNQSYTVIITDANGCTVQGVQFLSDSCDYVWPGDANDDAIADNTDILDIGIANGATGTTRANATLNWIGQPSTPWGQTLLSGTDYKWVDCDGSGAIDPVDTQAVVLNYGLIHNNRLIAPTWNAAAPSLAISFDQDTLIAGQTGTLTLSLGDTIDPANNIYGIAFRLNYDAAQLSTPTFGMTGGSTWFGNPGSDMMRVVLHPNASNGYVDVAITRLDQQNVTGFGTIGQIYFTATNAMIGSGDTVEVPMSITNVTLVDNTGAPQLVNVIDDELIVGDTGIFTAIAPVSKVETVVYPNPANETLVLQIPGAEQQMVVIEDLSGRIVYSQAHSAGVNTISVINFPAGVYTLRVSNPSGSSSAHKITIAH